MTRPIWDRCTPNQREILLQLARTGGSDKQLAAALGITEQGLKSRLRRIYDKLKIRRRSLLATAFIAECQDHPCGR
jgi:DNA-binding CsgD family transcriptional regulator